MEAVHHFLERQRRVVRVVHRFWRARRIVQHLVVRDYQSCWRQRNFSSSRGEHEKQRTFATMSSKVGGQDGDKVRIKVVEQIPPHDDVESCRPVVRQKGF